MTLSHKHIAGMAVGFYVCSGPRPGGHFYQYEAQEVRDMCIDHVCRMIENEIG